MNLHRPCNKHGFFGVRKGKFDRQYRASIQVMGRTIQLGAYATPELAAMAYDAAAEAHGFLTRNFRNYGVLEESK